MYKTMKFAAMLVACAGLMLAQSSTKAKADKAAHDTKESAKAAMTDHDVTYGRIKELTAGQKVVINVDNAPDKTFDMTDKSVKVTMAKTLKVGDPVKIQEHEVAGKTKAVTITKHTGGGVKHGDPHPLTK
jgi:sRNA-binding protein